MELGFMDDGLFEQPKDRSTKSLPISYNAKICRPQWFNSAQSEDPSNKMQLHKYRAEWAYRMKDYHTSLDNFQASLEDLLPSNNVTLLRDMMESVARCYVQLKDPENALVAIKKLEELPQSYDQKTVHLNLLINVYKDLGDIEGELLALQKLLWLHPMVTDYWYRLADIYGSLLKQKKHDDCRMTDDETSKGSIVKGMETMGICGETPWSTINVCTGMNPGLVVYTCLLRTRSLAASVRKHPPFVVERYQKMYVELSERLSQLDVGLQESDLKKCQKHVSQDLNWDADSKAEGKRETDLVKVIESKEFRTIFEQQWFSWG